MRRDDEVDEMARLHVIFFDNTLSHVASLLKVGMMQIVLAMIDAEQVNADLILDDPVETVVSWSHDVSLQSRARLANGDEVTAVELQLRFLEEAKRFVAAGGCDGIVPRADEIVALWEDTLLKLQSGDLAALASRLDWVLKFSLLQQVIGKRADLAWDSPQIKHLDHMYSSLDTSEGLYWAYLRSGFVERTASDEQIEHFVNNAPEDTRAWTRAALLSSVEPEVIDEVNWDFIRFKYRNESFRMIKRTLDLASPLKFTREDVEQIFLEAESLAELLDALGAPKEDESLTKAKGSWRGSNNASLGGLMNLWGKELTTSRAGTSGDEDLELES